MHAQSLWSSSAIAATAISIVGLTWLVISSYDPKKPQTLSQMATGSAGRMLTFRLILFSCSALFGLSILGAIAPYSSHASLIATAGMTMCLSEMVLATIPAKGTWQNSAHNIFGYIMGCSMFSLSILFSLVLHGIPSMTEITMLGLMTALFVGMILHKNRFVFYELAYIYASHITIVVMALSVKPKS